MELHDTKEYRNAISKIKSWKKKLEKTNKEGATGILREKRDFFDEMRETNPQLYLVFQISDKEISEIANRKILGKEITLD